MDAAALALIAVYIGIAAIPLIYNHRAFSTPPRPRPPQASVEKPGRPLGKSIVVFLNNLSDEQVERIMRETRNILGRG